MDRNLASTYASHNPDVLTCIANLSNDEVFTPPEFANKMLDSLSASWASANNGEDLWKNSSLTFLDPCTKSGVFLREIVKRLNSGLSDEIPDINKRINHILTNQIFGLGITKLTSLLARRSIYCSKRANGEHSIATSFKNESGNIWFETLEHTWVGGEILETSDASGSLVEKRINGKCSFCGASQKVMDREDGLETHAYSLIHSQNIQSQLAEYFGVDMQFDVVIGNPPYQLDDGGYGAAASPIYNKFVEQAKLLNPRFLSMVIPARWFSGGKGLDEFRSEMLNDDRIRVIEDFPDSNDVFPGTQIKGGVCYFLWERDNPGPCQVTTHDKGNAGQPVVRGLLEPGADVFIRYNEALPILEKIMKVEIGVEGNFQLPPEKRFQTLVSSAKPFGLRTFFQGATKKKSGDLTLFQNGGVGYISRDKIEKGIDLIDSWKVFIPRAGSGSDSFPHPILGKPFLGPPGSISTETYMAIGPFDSETQASNVITYITTRIFRLLVLLHKPSQDATRGVYAFVPAQDFTEDWDDEKLRSKYGITDDEMAFIERMIRPMELTNE